MSVNDLLQVPYPLISLVTRLPQTLQGQSPVTVSCRTFETFTISFRKDSDAFDVFESVKELTVASNTYSNDQLSLTHVLHQRLLLNFMHFFMSQTRLLLRMMVGHCILPEKNLAGWGLDLGRGRGGSLISTRTTRYVPLNTVLPCPIDSPSIVMSIISCTSGGPNENQ